MGSLRRTERCVPVFEQRDQLGVERAEDDQPAGHVRGVRRQPIDAGLEVRGELGEVLAAEVLELVGR